MIVLVMIISIVLANVVYLLYKLLNRKKYLGKLIFKVKESKSKWHSIRKPNVIFWIFMCCLWVYLITFQLINMYRHSYIVSYNSVFLSIFWIFASLTNILGIIFDKEIREHGVLIRQDSLYKSNIIYWTDITSYKWLDAQTLELTFQLRSFFNYEEKTTKVWTINQEDKEKIDSILNNYLNIR